MKPQFLSPLGMYLGCSTSESEMCDGASDLCLQTSIVKMNSIMIFTAEQFQSSMNTTEKLPGVVNQESGKKGITEKR